MRRKAIIVVGAVALILLSPAAATTETEGAHDAGKDVPDRMAQVGVALASGPPLPGVRFDQRLVETPRQKAHRIIAATWPKSQVTNAMRVVECESGFNQWAANLRDYHSDGSRGSYGWFQVGALWRHDPEVKGNVNRLYLPWTNARVAYRIWKRQGWRAWRNCAARAGLL